MESGKPTSCAMARDLFAVGPRGSIIAPAETPRLARVDEPTSRAAVRELAADDSLNQQRQRALDMLRAATLHGPATTAEITAHADGCDAVSIGGSATYRMLGRRLPDLVRLGRAVELPQRACAVLGRECKTWRATG